MSSRETARGAIHGVGYQRYLGGRRAQSTRWQVVLGNHLTLAWRGWLRAKIWLIAAFIATVALCSVLYVSQDDVFSRLVGRSGQLSFADGMIPFSFRSFLFPLIAFVLTLTAASGTVARDLRAGAFEFYFSRPVRPVDYVAGKLGAVAVLLGLVLVACPLALTLFRLGVSEDLTQLVSSLVLIPKVLVVGVASTLAYGSVALAFSALTPNPRACIAAWIGFYFVLGGIIQGAAIVLDSPALAAFDLKTAVIGLAFAVFDVGFSHGRVAPPLWLSVVSLAGFSGLSLAFLLSRVERAKKAGLGGG